MWFKKLTGLGKHRQTRFWVAPVIGVILAGVLASGALFLDQLIDWDEAPFPLFEGHPDTARTLLSVIASSVTTLLALIFTIIVVAIQLASSQYSPRTLSSLLQDRPSHFTIGVFIGTFTYTVILLLALRLTTGEDGDVVSGFSITLSFILAVISLGTFAVYSNHIIHSVRIVSIISRVAKDTRYELERLYPGPLLSQDRAESPKKGDGDDYLQRGPSQVILAPQPGIFKDLDSDRLLEIACTSDSTLVIVPAAGTFVPEGYPFVEVYGGEPENVLDHLSFAEERSLKHDIGYGLRQLSDIAIRGLSTGVNDPATAVQVLDQTHDLLRRLVQRDLSHGIQYDERGKVRVVLRTPTWDEILRVAVEEIRIYGAKSLQVARKLRAVLEDLERIAPVARKESLRRQLTLLDQAIDRDMDDPAARELARQADMRGTGF